ncbi:MAG: D-glycero-beta-D-manno-heptose 1,7-bisphosphate 7-phosphatase [Nanoarchaeota archaeon]|nr:D-glycero-beta-D-manno-heptose 1,7-bisphosphate 7-phosphatase [Nanoarchaeota archaeon]
MPGKTQVKENKAVFLDRDGVINEDKNNDYIHKIKDFKFISRVLEALKILSKSKYKIIIITNQSGIGRGYYKHEDFFKVTNYMLKEFKKEKIRIDAIYFCHHSPEQACKCRKPETLLLEQAKKRFNINLKKSYVIGDKTSDIMLGKKAGCKTILLQTGKTGKDNKYNVKADYTCKDLLDSLSLLKI